MADFTAPRKPGPDSRAWLQASAWHDRWHGQRQHSVLLLPFGRGQHFCALWQAWRGHSQRPAQLLVYSTCILREPPPAPLPGQPDSEEAAALRQAWPPPTDNLHLLEFDGGRVRLLLAFGVTAQPGRGTGRGAEAGSGANAPCDADADEDADEDAHSITDALRQACQLQADTLWVDVVQADPKRLARLAAPGARLLMASSEAAQSAAQRAAHSAALTAAGFVEDSTALHAADSVDATATWRIADPVEQTIHPSGPADTVNMPAPGGTGRRVALPLQAWRYAPRAPRRSTPAHRPPGQAVVLGAGIAGASAAAALARRGWACTVLDARPRPAGGASGNPAALVHGTVHAADGSHARFNRAAALLAQRVYAGLLTQGVPGALNGLLRRQAEWPATLPQPAWAQAWTAHELQARATRLQAGQAWFFPGAGWVDAAATVQALLGTPGVRFVGGACVSALQRQGDDWCVLDANGQTLACGRVLVLALAAASDLALPGLAQLLGSRGALPWPLARSRGQVSWFADPAAPQAASSPGPAQGSLPWPVAGGGYALCRPLDGQPMLLCGATTQADDEDPGVRSADHTFNLDRLQAQTGIAPPAGAVLHGRVGWRESTRDKLPLVGPVPDIEALAAITRPGPAGSLRLAQLPRLPGLFMLGAMAGRGFTWGPLAGEVLASLVDGSAVPLEADLVDALDPARFWLRQQRRGGVA